MIGMPCSKTILQLSSLHAQYILKNFTFNRKKHQRTLAEALNHPSFDEIDLIGKLLQFDPKDRLAAKEALNHRFFDEVRNINPKIVELHRNSKIIDSAFFITPTNVRKTDKLDLADYQMMVEELGRVTSRQTFSSMQAEI